MERIARGALAAREHVWGGGETHGAHHPQSEAEPRRASGGPFGGPEEGAVILGDPVRVVALKTFQGQAVDGTVTVTPTSLTLHQPGPMCVSVS